MELEHTPFLGVKELLVRSWRVWRARAGTYALLALPPALLGALLALVPEGSMPGPALVGASILVALANFWATLALAYAVARREQALGAQAAFGLGLLRLLPYLLTSLVAGVLMAVGFVLLIVPGVILMVWFSQITYVVALEGRSWFSALGRSRELVSGAWWGIFWRLALITFINALVGALVATVFSLAGGRTLADAANALASLALVPFSVAYATLVYEGLRTREREGMREEGYAG